MAPLISLSLLALPALLPIAAAAQNATSPQVFPAPQGSGAGSWTEAYSKAKALVSQMTLEEMNNMTSGLSTTEFSKGVTGCSGTSGAVPRLGFPGFCLQDAGNGVRGYDGANAYSSGVSVGASWNSSLAYQRAKFMGKEFKTKGAHVALGPVIGPLGRIAKGGRNWEGFTNDPYLAGRLGAVTVEGLQESVIACVKHYIGNEQETNRGVLNNSAVSSNIDDGPMHELYLWPFQDLVEAGAASIMCSYQKINNTYGCENSKTLNGLLKEELNFQGFVVTDWFAEHSGLPQAKAGLDMVMPGSNFWINGSLVSAVSNGSLERSRLEDMSTRILAAWYLVGQDAADYPALGSGMPKSIISPHKYVNAKDPAALPEILQQAIEGHVLVKNTNNALPLNKPEVLSIYGYDATARSNYVSEFTGSSSNGTDLWSLNFQAIGASSTIIQDFLKAAAWPGAPQIQLGTMWTAGGSGSSSPAYISTPYDAIASQAREDGTSIFHSFNLTNPEVPASSDACLVFINEFASEGWDRPGLAHEPSDKLVLNVASKCANTIVSIHNAGIRLVDRFVDHPNVTAVLFAHLPGQDAGRAVAEVLYGKVSPSGRLPYTVAKNESDYGNLLNPCGPTTLECDFSEGEAIDYRHFLTANITPRYEFGYGLTYSSFEYSNLAIKVDTSKQPTKTSLTKGNGGARYLFQEVGTITATVKNTGHVAAAEVAQLYLSIPGAPTKQLRGFSKVLIQPGESAEVEFPLRTKDVSRWNVQTQAWEVPKGSFGVEVGASVLDARLHGAF